MPPKNSLPPSSPSFLKSTYLILYNGLSAALWSYVLYTTLTTTFSDADLQTGRVGNGYKRTYAEVGEQAKWIQSLAGVEVLHAALGVVRAPLLTTIMQVASRFLLVWGIADQFPAVATASLAYSSMLVAWSVTEVIRYSYFALNLALGFVPSALTWLRYNTFFVLYPLGISSECWLVFSSRDPAGQRWWVLEWVLNAILLIYVPGAYILYTHMMAQRRKVMRSGAVAPVKKKNK